MTTITLGDGIPSGHAAAARALVGDVLDACDPRPRVERALRDDPIREHTPIHVLAFGKASIAMTRGVLDAHHDRVIGGVVLAPPELALGADFPSALGVHPVDHPTPTERNVDAAGALAEYADGIPPDHACVVCVSGGGSAHLCLPAPGVTLDEIIRLTREMNARGASIRELNEARTRLERLKGGGLARRLAHVRRTRVLVCSDVIGSDPGVIASGPMETEEGPAHTIVADNDAAVDAAATAMERLEGLPIETVRGVTGPAADAGRSIADRLCRAEPPGLCVVMGGETTVDATAATGMGGPACECALIAGAWLASEGFATWSVAGLATDGIDGPTDAAGAVLTQDTVPDHHAASRAAAHHDALGFLDERGLAIRTGPTGTNVNDLCVAWRTVTEESA